MSDAANTPSAGSKDSPKPIAQKVIRKAAAATAKAVSAKGKPWTFPKNTLEDALIVPKAIEEKNAGWACLEKVDTNSGGFDVV